MTVAVLLNRSWLEDGRRVATPLVLADTMATLRGHRGPKVLPATAQGFTAAGVSSVYLARKLYIFEDRIALAFAGDERSIAKVVQDIAAQAHIWLRAERPMSFLEAIVNQTVGVEVVGASYTAETGQFNDIAPTDQRAWLGSMGFGAVIGSGRAEMLKFLENNTSAEAGESASELCAAWLTGTALANEIGGFQSSWGGYLEHVSLVGPTWKRPPPTLHFFCREQRDAQGSIELELLPRAIAYEPGRPHGRLLSAPADDLAHEFVLADLLHPIPDDFPDAEAFWTAWRPARVSITVLHPPDSAGVHRSSLVFEEVKDQVIWKWGDDGLRVGVADGYRALLASRLSAELGKRG